MKCVACFVEPINEHKYMKFIDSFWIMTIFYNCRGFFLIKFEKNLYSSQSMLTWIRWFLETRADLVQTICFWSSSNIDYV